MNELRFFVNGKPAPGGSRKVFPIRKAGVLTGKFVVTDAGGMANKNWRANVAHAGAQAMKRLKARPAVRALELELIFHLPRPKSHFLGKSVIQLRAGAPMFRITRPDVGKLARSTQDALTGITWRDAVTKNMHGKFFLVPVAALTPLHYLKPKRICACFATIRSRNTKSELTRLRMNVADFIFANSEKVIDAPAPS